REALIAENGSVIDEATTIAKVSGFQYLIQQTAVETVASSAVVSWDLGMYFLPPPFTSSPELRKLDIPVLVRSANRQEEPVVTSTGSLIAWTERGSISYQGYYSVYRGDRVKFTLAPTEGGPRALAISNGVSDQIAPRVAEGSDGYLITWLQLDRPSIHEVRFQLHARRVSRAGVVLGGDDLVISDRPVSGFHEVVWNGSRFVVFWSEEGSLRRTIVSRDGAVGDSTEIARGFPLAAASSGGHSLVLFAQFSADDHSLRMLRLNANAELEADPAVLEESASSADVAAASGGWVLIYSHGDNSTVAQFLSLGGALAKPAEILSFTGPVHVAVSGEQVMVASSRFSYSARPVLHLTVLRLNDDTLTLLDSRSDEPALNFADPGPQVAGRDGGKFLLVYSRPSPEVDQSPSVIFDRLASIGPRPRGARH
ncbi:MAG TPA: hypothetical protein VHL58_02930, partial [Thermoanaerobaculia bacterium]|nr:hypothetical protein [Thermoanaerobaculia bacterium]